MIAALEPVDYVVLFEEEHVTSLIETVRPDVLVKGADQAAKVYGREIVEAYGGTVALAPLVEGFSTTNIIQSVLDRFAD